MEDIIGVTKFSNCLYEKGRISKPCSLHLTTHHLIIQFNDNKELWLLHSLIYQVEMVKKSTNNGLPVTISGGSLGISCRHFLFFRLNLSSMQEASDFLDAMNRLCFFSNIERTYAFSYHPENGASKDRQFNVLDPIQEYRRMGVESKSSNWRLSMANESFEICKSYPKILVVPAKISDNVLFHAAKFRTKNRIPVLSYLHKKNMCSITRSSQPLVGLKKKRSIQDEKLIEAIFSAQDLTESVSSLNLDGGGGEGSPNFVRNLIIDARPTVNAVANRAMGAGFESTEIYKNCKRLFMGIDNIHIMRESLDKMIDVITSPDLGYDKWISGIESSDWMKHIRNILDSVSLITKSISEEGANVLVHCSDGWDRTAQLSGLSQICLDPYYRTMIGYMVLIEKEWVFLGHKFGDRSGHLAKNPKSSGFKESAPVFHQYLECTWQIMNRYPTEFEFNETFLIEIFEHLYSCQFGNFLLNCESERESRKLKEKTYSLWPHLLEKRHLYINPTYCPNVNNECIQWMPGAQNVDFWTALYYRWDDDMRIAESFDHLLGSNKG